MKIELPERRRTKRREKKEIERRKRERERERRKKKGVTTNKIGEKLSVHTLF